MAKARTVLMAEDDEEWRRLVGFWLEKRGFRVVFSHNGRCVMPLARECRPDCFILDYDLGDMNGGEVCRQIKSDPQFEKIPVIILTASASSLPTIIENFPPDHFVGKTGKEDELMFVLEAFFPGKS